MPKTFVICSVRGQTESQLNETELKYITPLEKHFDVYWPPRDTKQDDPIGFNICKDNVTAMSNVDCVHIIFDPNSIGSVFDLGAAFTLKKPLHIINIGDVKPTKGKSFQNMILEWSKNGPPADFKVV